MSIKARIRRLEGGLREEPILKWLDEGEGPSEDDPANTIYLQWDWSGALFPREAD